MPFCSQCGHSVLDSARFCVSCGAANNSAIDAQATLDRSPSQPVAMPPSSRYGFRMSFENRLIFAAFSAEE